MNRVLLVLLVLFSVLSASAQWDPQFSQNMFNKLANNPGFAGSKGLISTSVLHRSQWLGFGDDGGAAISTQNFSIDSEIPFFGGVGLNIVKDNIAEFSNLGLQASYAYRTEIGVGQIGMGMSIGMFQSGLNGGALRPAESGDAVIEGIGDVKGSKFDIGAGVYFNTQDMYIGLSSSHMSEPTIEWTDGNSVTLERHYFLIAGYAYQINPELSLNPSIYLKSDGATSQLDINTNLIHFYKDNKKMWGGVSYRLDDGLILLAGMDLKEDLSLGIGYDVNMSNINSNSFEVMLGYNFRIKRNKAVSRYKNPRFL